jgi:hypothetical protein
VGGGGQGSNRLTPWQRSHALSSVRRVGSTLGVAILTYIAAHEDAHADVVGRDQGEVAAVEEHRAPE